MSTNRLQSILDTMEVPPLRRNDMQWLKRNLAVQNGKHPDFKEAFRLIIANIVNEGRQ